jgi:hypothetical protein
MKRERYLIQRGTCWCGTVTRMVYAGTAPKRGVVDLYVVCGKHREKEKDAAQG